MFPLRIFLFSLTLVMCMSLDAQDMSGERLKGLIQQSADTLEQNGNSIRFAFKERLLMCIYDENANRMRIISPIVERENIGEEELLNALVANFHSALDVKYALSDEIIWAVFIHPLKELSDHQVLDAIEQVYNASVTFGTTYSSTDLVFPGKYKKERFHQKKDYHKEGGVKFWLLLPVTPS